MLLTIVVPVHNTARYVRRCIDSILQQNVPLGAIEIVAVDDGSTDSSSEILAACARTAPNLLIVPQAHSGLGAARNAGIAHARGEYVWCVDSDDFLAAGALVRLLRVLEQRRPDALALDFACADEAGRTIDWIRDRFETGGREVLEGGEFFDLNYRLTYSWLYIFRTSLLRSHDIRFLPRINMQDAEMLPRALVHADRVLYAPVEAYVYVKRSESFVNSARPLVRDRYFDSIVEVRQSLQDFSSGLSAGSPMLSGVRKKVNVVEEILLLAYIYDELDHARRQERLSRLRRAGVYPFRLVPTGSGVTRLKRSLLCKAANLAPSAFPMIFSVLRRSVRAIREIGVRGRVRSPSV